MIFATKSSREQVARASRQNTQDKNFENFRSEEHTSELQSPTQSRQYPKDRSNTHDNHKKFKQIAQSSKHNHFESTKNTHKVHYSKPKKIIT